MIYSIPYGHHFIPIETTQQKHPTPQVFTPDPTFPLDDWVMLHHISAGMLRMQPMIAADLNDTPYTIPPTSKLHYITF